MTVPIPIPLTHIIANIKTHNHLNSLRDIHILELQHKQTSTIFIDDSHWISGIVMNGLIVSPHRQGYRMGLWGDLGYLGDEAVVDHVEEY